jgi:PleD family two-component response regulator
VTAHSDGRGRGSEFAVRLPLASNGRAVLAAPSESQLRRGRGAARHRRVLVVDDNSDLAFMIGNLLEVDGYEVEIANDPSEALLLATGSVPRWRSSTSACR